MELFFGSERNTTPELQRGREGGLLEAAALGEIHLHVAMLAGELVALGAFHREPHRRPEASIPPGLWRRRTGGRAVAAGAGFAVVTLALPHRAALVAPTAGQLRPDQVMNRAVRGLLESLRERGIDPVYPGLDFVTVERRTLAHLSFVERDDGATLFQAILALSEPLSVATERIDRLDPDGIVPTTMLASQTSVTLSACTRRPPDADPWDAAELSRHIAAGYARVFGLSTSELDPEVVSLIGADTPVDADDPSPPPFADAKAAARLATTYGRLGPVQGWLRCDEGRVSDAGICGDFVAPAWLPTRLAQALIGVPATRPEITAAVARMLDGDRGYVLGIEAPALVDLLLDSGQIA